MSERGELIAKFILLFSGLALFVALVYSGAESEKEEPNPVNPSPTPTETTSPKG